LLLRETADLMIERAVDRHRAVDLDRKPVRWREKRIADEVGDLATAVQGGSKVFIRR